MAPGTLPKHSEASRHDLVTERRGSHAMRLAQSMQFSEPMPNFAFPVTEFMSAPVVTVSSTDELNQAQGLIENHRISALAVVDDSGALIGTLSRTDLLRVGRIQAGAARKAHLLTLPHQAVSEIMTPDPQTVPQDEALGFAARLMVEHRVHRIFVLQDERLLGVVSTKDLMRAVANKRVNHPIAQYASSPVFTIRSHEPISMATERLERAKVSGLVVVDDRWPVGVFTQREALASKDFPRDTPTEAAMNPALLCLDHETRIFRAAEQALAMGARRVVAVEGSTVKGILTGLDFAKVVGA